MGGSGGESSGNWIYGRWTNHSASLVPGENFHSRFKSFVESDPQPSLLQVECPLYIRLGVLSKPGSSELFDKDGTPGNGGSSLEVTLISPLYSGGSEQPPKKYLKKRWHGSVQNMIQCVIRGLFCRLIQY